MRFKLSSLICVVTLIAVYLGLAIAGDQWMHLLTLVSGWPIVLGVAYGTGRWKAFFVGCLPAWVLVVAYTTAPNFSNPSGDHVGIVGIGLLWLVIRECWLNIKSPTATEADADD